MQADILQVAEAIQQAERILIITGAGLSADSGLPTYRGLGGLYNGLTEEGLPIETALSGAMLQRDPALCWKYLAQLGQACLLAQPNPGHDAIAALQVLKTQCWVLTQNIDGFHRLAGSPDERLIEIHGQLAPLYCQSCGQEDAGLGSVLSKSLPPVCARCGGILRPPVVLFEELLPEKAIRRLYDEVQRGFDLVMAVGTTASFPYILEPLVQARRGGGFTVEVNPQNTDISRWVDVHLQGRAVDVLPVLLGHIPRH